MGANKESAMYALGVVGGGTAVDMARRALSRFGPVAIFHLDDRPFRFPEFELVPSLDTILDAEFVRALYIATPVASHADLIRRIAPLGLPTLIEKPLCVSSSEARDLQDSHEDLSRFTIAFRKRYSRLASAIVHSRRHAAAGPSRTDITWLAPPPHTSSWKLGPWADGGGVILDLACHIFDLVEFTIAPVQELRCIDIKFDEQTKSDKYIDLELKLMDESIVRMRAGWAVGEPVQTASFSQGDQQILWVKDASKPTSELRITDGQFSTLQGCSRESEYSGLLTDFMRFSLDGTMGSLPGWHAGMRNMEILDRVRSLSGVRDAFR